MGVINKMNKKKMAEKKKKKQGKHLFVSDFF